jgi:DNA repair protein RadC
MARESEPVARMLWMDMAALRRETFRVLFLDGDNQVIADRKMWTGTVDSVQVHPREIVREALLCGATAVVLAHNHPSSQARPTGDDLATTRRIVDACATVGVIVHDHLIVSKTEVFSLGRAGLLPSASELWEAAR